MGLSTEQVDATQETGFALRVPRPYIARMRRGDPDDPLLRQVLPTVQESQSVAGYGMDPLRESAAVVGSGLLHKKAPAGEREGPALRTNKPQPATARRVPLGT